MSAPETLAKTVAQNRVALVVIVGGTVVVAILLAGTVREAGATATQAVRDIVRKVLSDGVLAALLFLASVFLGVPVLGAAAVAGVYLAGSTTVRAIGALRQGASRERGALLCEGHGGAKALLEAGGFVIAECRDGEVLRYRAD